MPGTIQPSDLPRLCYALARRIYQGPRARKIELASACNRVDRHILQQWHGQAAHFQPREIKRHADQETIVSDLTYDLRSGDPDFMDKLVALTFGNMAYDAILEGKSGLMSALVEGRYDLVPIPDPKLGPRKLDVASTYNTERYRPLYANKRGLPIFLNRAA